MYSQNNEELYITTALKDVTGNFLDIGAYDGKTFSNTLRLVELGWPGVCVEASPVNFVKLSETHKNRPQITLVMAAVATDASKLVAWYDSNGDGVSTTSVAHRDKWEAGSGVRFREFMLQTTPLAQLFEQVGFDFTFINIDVESTNLPIFLALPWVRLAKTKVICVEHDGYAEAMATAAGVYGFRRIALNAENLILAR